MTYEQLCKANELIATTDIKGKQYAEVPQRIKAFRSVYPDGTIQTEIISLENGVCVIKATIIADGNVIGIGHAYEKEGSTFINKTSYIENCETSAVGRALGMCGFGIDGSLASYEEVANAKIQQAMSKETEMPTTEEFNKVINAGKATKEQIEKISGVCSEDEVKALVKSRKVASLADLTEIQAKGIINGLKEKGRIK